MRRSLFAAAAFVIAATVPAAQQPSDRQTFRSGRAILTIDASVRDADGHPVLDLEPADFTVRIDGQPRAVVAARRFGETAAARVEPNPVGRFLHTTDAAPGFVVVVAVDRESIKRGNEKAAIDAAAAMIEGLSAADAAAAVAIPGDVIDVSRDRRGVADALRTMTGTRPLQGWTHHLSWEEVLAFDRGSKIMFDAALQRECPPQGPRQLDSCPQELRQQAVEMLALGRFHAQRLLATLTSVLEQLEAVRAPTRLVLLSGGIPFDEELASKYRTLADRAAQAHVALSILQIDQPVVDLADATGIEQTFAGPEYETGLANIASVTGGTFAHVVAGAAGVFDRIKTDVSHFYQIGVESLPSDADGKSHTVDVRVSRPHVRIVSPSATAVAPLPASEDAVGRALRQPLPVAELPFDAAFYVTHSRDRDKVRLVVAAGTPDGAAPMAWGFAIIDGGRVVQGRTIRIESATSDWSATATVDVPPGTYQIRIAAVGQDGRIGVVNAVTPIGLRSAGETVASDLIVGSITQGALAPRPSVRRDERAAAMIELSSPVPLYSIKAFVQIAPPGSTETIGRTALKLRTRTDDASVVVAEGPIDLSAIPPGEYVASAILEKDGKPFARISRAIEVAEGTGQRPTPLTVHAAPNVALASPARAEADTAALMERVSSYVQEFGEHASVLVAIEHYRQESSRTLQSGLPSGRVGMRGGILIDGTPVATSKTARRLTSEVALVRNAAAVGGWLGFRSVTEVDGKPTGDAERLRAVFGSEVPDLELAQRITTESTRYNVGPVTRTFNIPTATLFFFTPANIGRFTFHHNGHERIGDVDAWKIDFQETAKPTLVMNGKERDVPSTGTLWVDPAAGRVLRTRMMLAQYSGPSSMAIVEVTYRAEPALDMLVPATMREWYSIPRGSISAEATYTDYKRFQTSIRIK